MSLDREIGTCNNSKAGENQDCMKSEICIIRFGKDGVYIIVI